ncbi:carbohydrate ABC transporter permease [Butyrivibrio sp. INlla16]|uniref:carbohydrate ABC transporter permease n=1 Tax=Butyrivibrio sp. INlla16 TaxID=1520807 RepID=UPI00088762EE|nr:carbohydrate ABC transporter permease [Butyrivibrio sp. INlla16]SDB24282.1 putative aldouronate transport system permease protein [Butyrivibrio sp. INlla16]
MENLVSPNDSAYSKRANAVATILFFILTVLIFLPILLVFIVSFSTMDSITEVGYSFFPKGLSLDAYRYLMNSGSYLVRAFFNSVLITVSATLLGLFLMCPMAYVISRKEFRYRQILLVFLMIPMLFSGGMVASYMVNTQVLHLNNTYFALILPGLCSTWYILILRNYFQSAIPDSLIESAGLDGCRHPQIFLFIVVPVAKPVIMTVAVLQMFSFWNSWYPSLLYIDSNHTELYPLQYVLVNMERSIDAITKDAQYLSGMQASVAPAATIRMAMVVIVVLPVMILFPFFQKFLTTGMTVGAVKG